jgi:hypothetical protein
MITTNQQSSRVAPHKLEPIHSRFRVTKSRIVRLSNCDPVSCERLTKARDQSDQIEFYTAVCSAEPRLRTGRGSAGGVVPRALLLPLPEALAALRLGNDLLINPRVCVRGACARGSKDTPRQRGRESQGDP